MATQVTREHQDKMHVSFLSTVSRTGDKRGSLAMCFAFKKALRVFIEKCGAWEPSPSKLG